MKKIDVKIGERYGRLAVVREVFGRRVRHFECSCECGGTTTASLGSLRMKKTQSCGCLQHERISTASKKHGHKVNKIPTVTYTSWVTMKSRCNYKKNNRYNNYGGRGITYDHRWEKFENFLEDMGERPEGMTLDRIDNNGNYYKENCRWATVSEQARNRRSNHAITFQSETHILTEWADIIGVDRDALSARLSRGWTIERALTTP